MPHNESHEHLSALLGRTVGTACSRFAWHTLVEDSPPGLGLLVAPFDLALNNLAGPAETDMHVDGAPVTFSRADPDNAIGRVLSKEVSRDLVVCRMAAPGHEHREHRNAEGS